MFCILSAVKYNDIGDIIRFLIDSLRGEITRKQINRYRVLLWAIILLSLIACYCFFIRRQEEVAAEREEIDRQKKLLLKKRPSNESGRKRLSSSTNSIVPNASSSATTSVGNSASNNNNALHNGIDHGIFLKPDSVLPNSLSWQEYYEADEILKVSFFLHRNKIFLLS